MVALKQRRRFLQPSALKRRSHRLFIKPSELNISTLTRMQLTVLLNCQYLKVAGRIVRLAFVFVVDMFTNVRVFRLTQWTSNYVLSNQSMLGDPAPSVRKMMGRHELKHIAANNARMTTLIRGKHVQLINFVRYKPGHLSSPMLERSTCTTFRLRK